MLLWGYKDNKQPTKDSHIISLDMS